jgi:hypothetical protein
MYELTVRSRKQLERATLRSQARKPKIEEVSFGIYKVWSTNPRTPDTYYSVGIEPAQDGTGYDVCCTCPTQPHLDKKTGELVECFCYHVTSALPHYQMREREYRAEEIRMQEAQVMTDAEWEEVELRADTAQMLDDVREMLERDREQQQQQQQYQQICYAPGRVVEPVAPVPAGKTDEPYTEEMERRDREDLFG